MRVAQNIKYFEYLKITYRKIVKNNDVNETQKETNLSILGLNRNIMIENNQKYPKNRIKKEILHSCFKEIKNIEKCVKSHRKFTKLSKKSPKN